MAASGSVFSWRRYGCGANETKQPAQAQEHAQAEDEQALFQKPKQCAGASRCPHASDVAVLRSTDECAGTVLSLVLCYEESSPAECCSVVVVRDANGNGPGLARVTPWLSLFGEVPVARVRISCRDGAALLLFVVRCSSQGKKKSFSHGHTESKGRGLFAKGGACFPSH